MFYRDHMPPHFHAFYAEHEILVHIESGEIEGYFPKRALSHVMEWYNLHKDELLDDWKLARQERPLTKIAPLE